MIDHPRDLSNAIRSRLDEASPLIQVVVGPRQVGKTTALKSALGAVGIYHSADYPTPTPSERLVEWWQQAAQDESRLLAVDEIQKVVNWSETVK